MIQSIAKGLTSVVSRYLPDPLIFAILLTIIVFFASWGMTPTDPAQLVTMWGDGFWSLLAFGMQMALIVVTGHALASSGPVKNILRSTAAMANSPANGVMLVTFVGSVCCAIQWGFGLVVGAMLAKEVARRVKGSDYRLLIACAYISFLTWHGGLSSSIALMAATPGNPVESITGLIPVKDTLLTSYNLFITFGLIIIMPFVTRMMMPKAEDVVSVDPALLAEDPDFQKKLGPDASFAEKIEESRILSWIVGALGFVYLGMYLYKTNFNVTINTVNLAFLVLGIMLHKTPMAYMRAITAAARSTAGILVQFPFYAGIHLMMEKSGLGGLITQWFIDISSKDTFPILTFFSSAIINFAIPSGGGHWVVQGPFVMPAAQALGADLGKSAMAIAYGEAWMNMAQPFWALPPLAIAGLGVRDIMGYCVTALIFSMFIFLIGLAFL
ncbi:TIGR00366 family protein [Microvirga sp. W0021]|uniref:TIGR00366 family protein n=1 Tax=Hohaiivirga grylli TaxID=3133970 RepID=A0ABV0BJK6_9HYPH